MNVKEKTELKRKLVTTGALALGAKAWCVHRNKKYPLAKGYGFLNKIIFPGAMITPRIVKLANTVIAAIGLPPVRDGLVREQITIVTRDQAEIDLSVYSAKGAREKQPCLVYFHGGGFFLKGEAHFHTSVMAYAERAACTVVFVEYRTADGHPFPVPFYDCCDALQYVWENAAALGIDKERIAVGGDSAGGALAAAGTHWCKAQQIPLCFQLLIYPVTDRRMQTNTARQYTDCPSWNAKLSKKMWALYLRDGVKEKPEYASPILAKDFSDLPPAFVEIEEFDSLSDEGRNYAQALRSAGVPVELSEIKGSIHGFDVLTHTELTKKAIAKRSEMLYRAFHGER